MKEKYYSVSRSVQILISLLKQHNVHKIIASPGTGNFCFVASAMNDDFFQIYSSVDERSAAYMACGMAAESGEPVVITCTEATASRNYLSGLTEAYYRKLPVCAITAAQDRDYVGHLHPQVIDRNQHQHDVALVSELITESNTEKDVWANTLKINRALLAMRRNGGGPVHIDLTTEYSKDFSVKELPTAQVIRRTCTGDDFPDLPSGKVAIVMGNHRALTSAEEQVIDRFCAEYNSVVFCDQTSNYKGKYRVQFSIVLSQERAISSLADMDLLIHVGEVSGDYNLMNRLKPQQVWRVSEDGEIRDFYKKLVHVFEMPESTFFSHYIHNAPEQKESYLKGCLEEIKATRDKVQEAEVPFSNIWMASQAAGRIPENSVVHFGILNSLRSWNFFDLPKSVLAYCNTGGFGIDGDISAALGAALANPNKLFFLVVGDLAFFYDLNSLGNRHLPANLRILLVNNGKGTEFRNFIHYASEFGDDADKYFAAGGHFGNKSHKLVKHYAEDLGMEYLTASTKEEFKANIGNFLTEEALGHPVLFETFTKNEDESSALKTIYNLNVSTKGMARELAKKVLSKELIEVAKKIAHR